MKAKLEIRNGSARVAAGLVAALLIGVVLAGLPTVFASGASYNNVQIFVTTDSTVTYSYFFTAYNLTGQLVGSTQTPYPAAAFELPAGTYLFTVSAMSQTYYSCYLCAEPMIGGTTSGSSTSTMTTKGSAASSAIVYRPPSAEYGYKVEQVSGPDTISITTQNITQFPTTPVTVKVTFANGTEAAGVSVSVSVIGQWYYWWGNSSTISMEAQTGPDGVANLVIPRAPAVVSAWDWVPVNKSVPANQSVSPPPTKVNVSGQVFDVTTYWETTYVGLAASALIIPPTDSVSLTLQPQSSGYWVEPMGTQVASATANGVASASVSNGAKGVPSGTQQATNLLGASSQYYLPSAIPSLQTGSSPKPASAPALLTLTEGGVLGVAVAAGAAVAFVARRRGRTPALAGPWTWSSGPDSHMVRSAVRAEVL